ncbi:MAG: penicillin-binding transpeptidase domain-containing protein, partial [Pseudomonadota bacterium]
ATAAACGRQNAELYGLCEALARSSNMWFAKLALAENTVPLDALYEVAGAPPVFTGAGQTLRALGLNASVPLVRLPAAIDAEDTFAPRVEPPRLPSAPGLAAGQLRPDPLGLHELNVGINAYGQNAFVTPLTLATVAGAIGLGHTVSPFIASTKDAVAPRRVQLLPPDSRSQGLMDEIRQGMAAVMAPGGTGHIRFGVAGPGAVALRPLVRGKTGTATIGKIGGADVYTHWFVGYLESEAGTPQYAFACAVSHLRESGACATVVGEWLQRLRAKGHL